MKIKMLSKKQVPILSTIFIIILLPYNVNLLEYGNECTVGSPCISEDFRDPLVCNSPTTTTVPSTTVTTTTAPTTTVITTEEPTTSTEESTTTTEEPTTTTEEPATTTEVPPTTANATTEEPATTTEVSPTTANATTEEPPTTTEVPPTTTEEPPTTTEVPPTTEESPTTTEVPPTTTEEPPTTTEVPPTTTTANATTEEPTITTEVPPTTTAHQDNSGPESLDFDETYNEVVDAISHPFRLFLDDIGKCSCVSGTFRHEDLDRCVSPHSGDCDLKVSDGSPMRTCTKFARCFPTTSDSTEGTCHCDADAIENSNTGYCILTHGSTNCETRNDCDTHNFLTCRNNTCVCEFEDIQKWNSEKKTCGYVSGESCANNNTPFPNPVCIENAECKDEICQCVDGFLETPEKECKLPFNGTCEVHSDCHPSFTCANSTCMCMEGQLYFASTDRCHLLEGSECDITTDICTLGSQCVNGTCICDEGYEPSNNHTCQALYGSRCSPEISCHEQSYLGNCSASGKCDCKPNYSYHPILERCVGNIDEACRESNDCFEHAICYEEKCACGGFYIPGDDKQGCFTRYGDQCDIIECFPGHFLKCDENRTCTCANPEDQTYDYISDKCVAFAGRPCYGSGGGIGCVENAVCDAQQDGLTKCTCYQGYSANVTGYCVEAQSGSTKISGFTGLMGFFMISLTVARGNLL